MKQQKRHSKAEKGQSKNLPWWIILPALSFCLLALEIGNNTLVSYNRWYIPFAIIGLAIGVVRLIRDKDIVWNWKEYLGGIFYAFIHSVMAILIATAIFSIIFLLNFYLPTNHPDYEETVTVINKVRYGGKRINYHRYTIIFHFKSENFKDKSIGVGKTTYNQANPGDTYIFTLQNGFFNIPVIKDKAKQ
ncbi:hypothetical protein [uncultured Bacteroides sp.]|uniref:hypothetical protein n=1 Tax=uncultured Bacteroides sp. TaxID=162156 RepID=UPI0025EFE65B|nr:hypothetical protein [uncultured Bacteroides sp.]